MCLRLSGAVIGTEAQVFVHAIRVHHLPRIHLSIVVPNSFKLAECLDQLVANFEHEAPHRAIGPDPFVRVGTQM